MSDDVNRSRDPFALMIGARSTLDSLRGYLANADDWRTALQEPIARAFALDDLWLVGELVARLTVLVESCGSPDPELFLDLADRADELHELRAQIAARRSPNDELRASIRESRPARVVR